MDITTNIPAYRFPLLKTQEIVESLAEVGIDISSNELMEPHRHKEKVKSVYNDLVLIGLDLQKDSFTTMSISLMKKRQSLPHPELHDESFANLKFIKALMKLMRICGINDFSLSDLHSPSTKRFKRHLSGTINYIKFTCEKQQSIIHELGEHKDDIIGGLLEMKDEQDMLHAQHQKVTKEAEERWKEAHVVDDDCGEIEIEIAKQNKLQTSIRQESQDLKKKANMLKDKLATAELAIQELSVKERKLVSQVVESPEQLEKDIKQLSKQLVEEQKRCMDAQQIAKDVTNRVQNVTHAQDQVADASALIRNVVDEKIKYDRSIEESKSIEEKLSEYETESAKYRQLYVDLEEELRQIEENTTKFHQQSKDEMNNTNKTIHNLNSELHIIEKEKRDITSKVEQCEQEVQVLKRFIDEKQSKTDEEITTIISSFKQMEVVLLEKIAVFDKEIMTSRAAIMEEQKQQC